jgi:hypothetical protein
MKQAGERSLAAVDAGSKVCECRRIGRACDQLLAQTDEPRVSRHRYMQLQPWRSFEFVENQLHDTVIPAAELIVQRYARRNDDGLAQKRRHLDDLAAAREAGTDVGSDIDRPHADAAEKPHRMVGSGRHPHGASRRHNPTTVLAHDRHHAGKCMNQLRTHVPV